MDINVPAMETDAPDAEVLEVLVAVGDRVEEGQLLFIVAFDKANVDITSPATGVVTEIATSEGELVDPEQLLAKIAPDTT